MSSDECFAALSARVGPAEAFRAELEPNSDLSYYSVYDVIDLGIILVQYALGLGTDPVFASVPKAKSQGALELVQGVFDFFDDCLQSTDKNVREAVILDVADGDIGPMKNDVILRFSGPRLRDEILRIRAEIVDKKLEITSLVNQARYQTDDS